MYGLSKTTNVTFLIGNTLSQICVGLFQLILNFEGDVSISVEGIFEYGRAGSMPQSGPMPQSACLLIDLLGKEIGGIEILDHGTLAIHFSNGTELTLHDSNANGESYQIVGPGVNIVV